MGVSLSKSNSTLFSHDLPSMVFSFAMPDLKKLDRIALVSLLKSARTGDLLFYSEHDECSVWTTKLRQFFGGSRWQHIYFIVRVSDIEKSCPLWRDTLHITPAEPPDHITNLKANTDLRTKISRLDCWREEILLIDMEEKHSYNATCFLDEIQNWLCIGSFGYMERKGPDLDPELVMNALLEMRDKPYPDTMSCLASACGINQRKDDSSMFCSEAMAFLYKRIGILNTPKKEISNILPYHFESLKVPLDSRHRFEPRVLRVVVENIDM